MNDELLTVWYIDHSKAVYDGLFLKNWEIVPVRSKPIHEQRLHGYFYYGKPKYHLGDGKGEVFVSHEDAVKALEKKLNKVISETNKKQAAIARYYSNKETQKNKETANDEA